MDLALGIIADLSLIAGIVIAVRSFRKGQKANRSTTIALGVALIVIGVFFGDWGKVFQAGQRGYDDGFTPTTVETGQ